MPDRKNNKNPIAIIARLDRAIRGKELDSPVKLGNDRLSVTVTPCAPGAGALPYLLFILCFFVSLSIPQTIAAQDFTITKFHADITVNNDASLHVRETILVNFHESRHGIYREIPFKYSDERGNTIRTPLHVQSVTDQTGTGRKYRVARKGNIVNLRIGDSKHYVSGFQTYVITYEVQNAVLFLDDHDELYWNITGNYWWSQIQEASAQVTLAAKEQSKNLWAACYTGAFGSGASLCRYEASHNSAEFSTTKSLSPREGLTVAFGWDKGLVPRPTRMTRLLWLIDMKENWIFLLPFVTVAIMVSLWRTQGRDPGVREAVTVKYEPPKYQNVPLTAGEVGALIDEKLDPRDITSTIVGLAVKGYIRIEEQKTEGLIFDSADYYLWKAKGPDDALSPFEKLLMSKIFTGEFPGRMVSDMKNKFYADLESIKSTLYEELTSKRYFLVSPEKVRRVYSIAGIIIAVACAILFSILISSPQGVFAGILMGLPVLAFAKVMPAKTRAGAAVYMDILGFQEFMNRAEKDQLERMGDKDLFSKFLPYAIALNVVDNWAGAFEGIYQESPQWYVSHTGSRTFHPSHFSRSISSATSGLASAIFSAPRGSGAGGGGSFGGGFSGGGFGGGGGGSW